MIIFAVIGLLLDRRSAHLGHPTHAIAASAIFKILIGDGSVVGIDVATETGR